MDTIIEDESPRARLALLLQQFSELNDDREAWRIVYPIEEVLLLVTCATIASCDDFEDIVEWGEHHLDFLRQFSVSTTAFPARAGCGTW
jgi:DDE_Tnp_1-associated